jgi:hypothetical protein
MAGAPLISVVIPCYNHARFLREAVESAVSASRPAEVLIVDDGSTDDSVEVAESCVTTIRGASLRIIRQPNAGVSAARNRGFRESRGELVVFLDSDDRLAPGALDVGARSLGDHPEAVFVYGRCRMMAVDGTLLPTPQQPRIARHAYHELLRNNYIWTPANVMFRRDALERCGTFNPALSGCADYELYLRLARTYPVYDHGQLVAHFRRHGTNMRGRAAEMLRETLMVLRSQRSFVDGSPDGLAAYREGWRSWQEFFGLRLLNEIRDHVHAGEWLPALHKSVVLGTHYPRGLSQHTRRLRRARALSVQG